MIREIIDINDFTILVESTSSDQVTVDSCTFDEPIIAVAFYGAGNVHLAIKNGAKTKEVEHTRKLALSFYADEQVEFVHTVSPDQPLQCILIATALRNISNLPNQEGELFHELLHELVQPKDHYVQGPQFLLSPEMLHIVDQVFANPYTGKTKMMFFRSQMTTLLSHFFGQLAQAKAHSIKEVEREKLFEARDILSQNLESPPSLNELSRLIGLNTFKLKKNFKALFGVPVFKYLQNERMDKAHQLLNQQDLSVQEIAWEVGYDSLSSFSNAFSKKFGYRPSAIRS